MTGKRQHGLREYSNNGKNFQGSRDEGREPKQIEVQSRRGRRHSKHDAARGVYAASTSERSQANRLAQPARTLKRPEGRAPNRSGTRMDLRTGKAGRKPALQHPFKPRQSWTPAIPSRT